jgi:hypothetical protein
MTLPDLVLYDEEFHKIKDSLQRLASDANANVVFLVDKNGQQIAAVGDLTTLDTTSLASLTAGNVAATDGLARLIGEKEFSILFHEGERDNIHISIVAQRGDPRRDLRRAHVARARPSSGPPGDVGAREDLRGHRAQGGEGEAGSVARLRLSLCGDHGRRHRPVVLGVVSWTRRSAFR